MGRATMLGAVLACAVALALLAGPVSGIAAQETAVDEQQRLEAKQAQSGGGKPNIVYVLVDDLGWADVAYNGGNGKADIQTPNMDALRAEGVALNRHYTYNWCGPSRSSLLSGRLPVHVNVNYTNSQALNRENVASGANGIPSKMTVISAKMKEAGYATHYQGKWGVGFARPDMMPLARGFDSFLGYLHDSNDYYTSTLSNASIGMPSGCEAAGVNGIVDLVKDDGPAYGLNGTMWEDYLFIEESLKRIAEHPAEREPLFLFHAFHSVHCPHNPPVELEAKYAHIKNPTRRAYAAQTSFVDDSLGRIVAALKDKGMWDNTLLVVSSDNGGPTYPGQTLDMFGGADNRPLRGGKTSDWEGGIRVNAFVSGALLPEAVRGTALDDYIHLADWWSTFCALAGVDPTDTLAAEWGLPPIDSINQWPLLSGAVPPGQGNRTSMHISPVTLIDGRFKLLTGADPGNINQHTSPGMVPFNTYGVGYGPAAVRNQLAPPRDCSQGCLYDIFMDPEERHDRAAELPDVTARMLRQLEELNESVFQPDRGTPDIEVCSKLQAIGYYGPFSQL